MKFVIVSILYLVIYFCTSIAAQNVEARLTVIEDNDSLYTVKLSIRSTEKSLKLGNASFRLRYNRDVLYFDEDMKRGKNYLFNTDLNTGYLFSATSPTENEVAINLFNNNEAIIVSKEFYDIVTLKFNKLSIAEDYETNFVLTEIYEPNSTIPLSCNISPDDSL